MHDNAGQLEEALRAYHQFLQVAKEIEDTASEALAYNAMGVDEMAAACPAKTNGEGFGAAALSDQSVERLEKAIKLHERHLAIADAGGRFAAFGEKADRLMCASRLSASTRAGAFMLGGGSTRKGASIWG